MPTTPPDFSVLLLAWDDADPTVAVLGGAALPPTLPLVYQLAAQHPVLAIYPHLPAGESAAESTTSAAPARPVAADTTATPATAATGTAATAPAAAEAAADALATAVDGPGIQVLPALTAGQKATIPALQSRIIGLAELDAAAAPVPAVPLAATTKPLVAPRLTLLPVAGRSQWPTGVNAPVLASGEWQAPAAPYLGAGAVFAPPPPAPPRPLVAVRSAGARRMAATSVATVAAVSVAKKRNGADETAALAPGISTPPATIFPHPYPQAVGLDFDPDPQQPTVQQPAVFEEITEEVGAGEAADISAPENDLVPEAAAETAPAPEAAAPIPAPAGTEPAPPTVLTPRLDGLNSRMIQYARQAAQMVRGRADFGVIYAPNWPAWLAALEIRNSTRRPLVLYVASLATDLANPAEHGYQLEMERMTMRRARLILVPDETLRRRLLALYEDAADKVRVVPADDETAIQHVLSGVAVG